MKKAITLLGILVLFFNTAYGDLSNWGDNSTLRYDGSQDVTQLTGSDQLSISFWVAPTDNQNTDYDIIVNQENTYEVALTTDNKIKYAINVDTNNDGVGDSWYWIETDVQLTPDEYQNIVLTYDGNTGTVKIYKDGEEVYSKTDFKTGTLTSNFRNDTTYINSGLEIANRPWKEIWGADINVSGVGIFNKTLTPEEIEKLYNGTMTAEEFNDTGVVFFAPLIGNTSDIINGFNGTTIGDTINVSSEAPENLERLLGNIVAGEGGGTPIITPIPISTTLIAISLIMYLILRKRRELN
ncbi:LamG domain-containing protein [Methanothermococcus sp. Ax23]|uniref:LamG domain-containing protein n=1 Tax=Methanothermococcus sp. Ax23 TaxID=3156486 RepID=UPI003B9F1871